MSTLLSAIESWDPVVVNTSSDNSNLSQLSPFLLHAGEIIPLITGLLAGNNIDSKMKSTLISYLQISMNQMISELSNKSGKISLNRNSSGMVSSLNSLTSEVIGSYTLSNLCKNNKDIKDCFMSWSSQILYCISNLTSTSSSLDINPTILKSSSPPIQDEIDTVEQHKQEKIKSFEDIKKFAKSLQSILEEQSGNKID
jgi:hypothetical protein